MRRVTRPDLCVLAAALLSVAPASAAASEQPRAACAPQADCADQQPKPAPQQPRPTPAPSAPRTNEQQGARERQPEGRPVNLQVDLTITDQVESEPAQKKTVSMVVADRAFGRVRASGPAVMGGPPGPPVTVQLNVDARPAIQANDTIRLELTLEYQPMAQPSSTDGNRRPSHLNESLTVLLQPGKPLTVSRAVDPSTNRRTSVEVTATIMK